MPDPLIWSAADRLTSRKYTCGHCGTRVASNNGYHSSHAPSQARAGAIYICHFCGRPTFFDSLGRRQVPGVSFGNAVANLSPEVKALYEEARRCATVNAWTATVLCCRKLLMNVAVDKGAPTGKSFVEYVGYLGDKGYIPRGGDDWVDHIRKKGNEATHEIPQTTMEEAKQLVLFSQMLLNCVYGFPSMQKKADEPDEKKE